MQIRSYCPKRMACLTRRELPVKPWRQQSLCGNWANRRQLQRSETNVRIFWSNRLWSCLTIGCSPMIMSFASSCRARETDIIMPDQFGSLRKPVHREVRYCQWWILCRVTLTNRNMEIWFQLTERYFTITTYTECLLLTLLPEARFQLQVAGTMTNFVWLFSQRRHFALKDHGVLT